MTFLAERARGKILTGARFIRNFVTEHAEYKQDSYLNEKISYDLLKMLDSLNDPTSKARTGSKMVNIFTFQMLNLPLTFEISVEQSSKL